ncbi:hypothetical protein LTS18_003793 [Coniosporium uncinatum]|uniref:Uncharacterized protein n=1 Tax=Coniosporium uncinatum TaxID=93489 RepID=A0ACC3D6E8_9PEZI|nr:hypothetical protein LTS18_003793 [Coniosporium uncinatum]
MQPRVKKRKVAVKAESNEETDAEGDALEDYELLTTVAPTPPDTSPPVAAADSTGSSTPPSRPPRIHQATTSFRAPEAEMALRPSISISAHVFYPEPAMLAPQASAPRRTTPSLVHQADLVPVLTYDPGNTGVPLFYLYTFACDLASENLENYIIDLLLLLYHSTNTLPPAPMLTAMLTYVGQYHRVTRGSAFYDVCVRLVALHVEKTGGSGPLGVGGTREKNAWGEAMRGPLGVEKVFWGSVEVLLAGETREKILRDLGNSVTMASTDPLKRKGTFGEQVPLPTTLTPPLTLPQSSLFSPPAIVPLLTRSGTRTLHVPTSTLLTRCGPTFCAKLKAIQDAAQQTIIIGSGTLTIPKRLDIVSATAASLFAEWIFTAPTPSSASAPLDDGAFSDNNSATVLLTDHDALLSLTHFAATHHIERLQNDLVDFWLRHCTAAILPLALVEMCVLRPHPLGCLPGKLRTHILAEHLIRREPRVKADSGLRKVLESKSWFLMGVVDAGAERSPFGERCVFHAHVHSWRCGSEEGAMEAVRGKVMGKGKRKYQATCESGESSGEDDEAELEMDERGADKKSRCDECRKSCCSCDEAPYAWCSK